MEVRILSSALKQNGLVPELEDDNDSKSLELNARVGSNPTKATFGLIAQLVERLAEDQSVGGSNPSQSTLKN